MYLYFQHPPKILSSHEEATTEKPLHPFHLRTTVFVGYQVVKTIGVACHETHIQ